MLEKICMVKKFLILFIFLLYLSGCSSKEGIVSCSINKNEELLGYNINSVYFIKYRDNYVIEVIGKDIITSEFNDILDNLEEELKTGYQELEDLYGGHNYEVIRDNNKLISNLNINFKDLKLEEYIKDIPLLTNYYKNNKLLKEGLITYYEDGGYICN